MLCSSCNTTGCTQKDFTDWLNQLFSGATPKAEFGLGHPPLAMVQNLTQLYLDEVSRLGVPDPTGPRRGKDQWFWAAHRVMADGWKTCSARRTARAFSGPNSHQSNAFLYFCAQPHQCPLIQFSQLMAKQHIQ
jgi:hypothetical protein